jgi:CRP-like cAMP-binding protein
MLENDVAISVESFFCQSTSKEYIQALEETDLWYITYEELQDTYSKFPEFNLIGRIITENYYVLSEQRSACMRQQRAPERYRFLLENYPTLIQRVPSKYLASYLGITEVTLSIIKSKKLAY